MAFERKKTLNVSDPMPHVSRNRVPQPFFLVGEADHVLIQMSGVATLELREVETTRVRLVPGDSVYIPAGTPSRLVPEGENVVVRLKAEPPAREAVAWYCDACGALVHHRELEAGFARDQYWTAVSDFNADAAMRTCGCGTVHPMVDLGDAAFASVAAALRGE